MPLEISEIGVRLAVSDPGANQASSAFAGGSAGAGVGAAAGAITAALREELVNECVRAVLQTLRMLEAR
jgi:hypothetical protein